MGIRVARRRGRKLGPVRALARAAFCVFFPIGFFWCVISPRRHSIQDIAVYARSPTTGCRTRWARGPGRRGVPHRERVRAGARSQPAAEPTVTQAAPDPSPDPPLPVGPRDQPLQRLRNHPNEHRHRRPHRGATVLTTLATAQFLMTLDSSVMNVSIATVAEDVGTDVTGIQTAITLYTLVMASLMITGGKIGGDPRPQAGLRHRLRDLRRRARSPPPSPRTCRCSSSAGRCSRASARR